MNLDLIQAALPPGLHVISFPNGVVNLNAPERELAREDVDALRAALREQGLEEAESWIAWQGQSWMSDGVFAGVSIRTMGGESMTAPDEVIDYHADEDDYQPYFDHEHSAADDTGVTDVDFDYADDADEA